MTCAWTPDPACLGEAWDALDAEVKERSLMLATSALQGLTLYRVGTCPITIRPATTTCGCGFNPHLDSEGNWLNSCGCDKTEGTTQLHEFDIPGPVGYIEELRVDGQVVDLFNGDWRLDNGHLLVWQGEGEYPIPANQDLSLPDTAVGTWSLTYSKSYPVLADGRLAVAYLAMEFAKACQPKAKCALPRGVTSVVRNGVSFTIQAGLFPNGLTNIDIVDQYILKWAPAGAPLRSAQVFDPRTKPPRIVSSVPMKELGSV